jgi:hypothetical protein
MLSILGYLISLLFEKRPAEAPAADEPYDDWDVSGW